MSLLGAIVFSVSVFTSVGIFMYCLDRKTVRKGHCGQTWKIFDYDSQGGQGLQCRQCGEITWVSWYKLEE